MTDDTERDPDGPPAEAEAMTGTPPVSPPPEAHVVPGADGGVRCPRCGTTNRAGVSFCASCGGRLIAASAATQERPGEVAAFGACPRCGSANRADAVFCANCGQALQAFAPTPAERAAPTRARRALLGPLVLLIAAAGLLAAWFLPFGLVGQSLAEHLFGPAGTGPAFWTGYPGGASVIESAFYAIAAPLPLVSALLVVLAVAGLLRAVAGRGQRGGAWIAIVWSAGFIAGFLLVEVAGGFDSGLIGLLRGMSPAGLIGFLASLIAIVGAVTRLADS